MALVDDGDLIRGVGFVAIYAAYVEEALDSLLSSLEALEPIDEKVARAQASKKIKEIKRRLKRLGDEFEDVRRDLDTCRELLEARHEIIHGRIYAQANGPDMLHPARPGKPKRPASSIELYDLANALSTCSGLLVRPQQIRIPRAISTRRAT